MNWLPKQECSLYLTHNDHKIACQTVEDHYDPADFVSDEEYIKAIATDNVWELHWYPVSPVGFHCIAASSLEAIQTALKENDYA